jgi:hypothetical protein
VPRMNDTQALGLCCYTTQGNTDEYPATPTSVSVFCREHGPRRRAARGERWFLLSEQEAREKRLFCHVCRRFLVTGEEVPRLTSVFTEALGGDPSLALWVRAFSWVVACGFQRWIEQGTVPQDLWVYTRPVLLRDLGAAIPIPVHVTLEVEIRYGSEREQTAVRHLDSLGCAGGLLVLMARVGATHWVPLRERFAPAGLGSHEKRALFSGIRYDQGESERLARSLRETFGPFSLEWLYGADRLNAVGIS